MLERGTRTIVQQVETMQQMVNAFSEYARAPEMQITRFSLNQLVTEVADLYRSQDPRARSAWSSTSSSRASRRTAVGCARSSTTW